VIVATFVSPDFFTQRNITNVLRQSAVVGISSMGMLLVILTRGIDLSVGSIAACGSVFSAYFLATMPIGGSIAMAVGIGCLMGAFTGYLVAVRKMPPFVVTLGVMTIARGIGFIVSKGQPITVGEDGKLLTDFGKGVTLGIAQPVILMLLVFAIVWFILHFTAFGRLVTAIGSNEEAVRLSGINIGWYIFATYVISGGLSALAGVVSTARSAVGSPVLGIGMELDVIAAVVIGGASLMGGRGTAFNTLLGVLILAVIGNIMNLQNVPGYHQQVVKGVIILVAVLFQSGIWTKRRA
jgi:ribose transport system permease protein